MIYPQHIVNPHYCDERLQELLIFTICVAGKKASMIAPRVDQLFKWMQVRCGSPLPLNHGHLLPLDFYYHLSNFGIGCARMKSTAILQAADLIAHNELDLRTCTVEELEAIYGIGPKSARAFIMWSRPGVRHAIIDTHILKWLKQQGVVKVPKATPTGKQYLRLEQEFLNRVPMDMSPAEFDLSIWKQFAA